jgi:hypothetical protein
MKIHSYTSDVDRVGFIILCKEVQDGECFRFSSGARFYKRVGNDLHCFIIGNHWSLLTYRYWTAPYSRNSYRAEELNSKVTICSDK